MNQPDEMPSDEALGELLAPLRNVTVPDAVQAANRAAISVAISRTRRAPWWQQTVSVPIPLAVAATVVLVATMIALSVATSEHVLVQQETGQQMRQQLTVTNPAKADAEESISEGWTITRSYIGSLSPLATSRISVSNEEKEQGNDS